jgi:hypothetical protein
LSFDSVRLSGCPRAATEQTIKPAGMDGKGVDAPLTTTKILQTNAVPFLLLAETPAKSMKTSKMSLDNFDHICTVSRFK